MCVCVFADTWNDYTGGVTSDKHRGEKFWQSLRLPTGFVPTSPVIQYVPPCSMWRHLEITEMVSAVKDQGQCGSCLRSLLGGVFAVGTVFG